MPHSFFLVEVLNLDNLKYYIVNKMRASENITLKTDEKKGFYFAQIL